MVWGGYLICFKKSIPHICKSYKDSFCFVLGGVPVLMQGQCVQELAMIWSKAGLVLDKKKCVVLGECGEDVWNHL